MKAIIAKVSISDHPNADNLSIGTVLGNQVIIRKDSFVDGEKVIFFSEGGQLSHDYCYNNNLYREGHGQNITYGSFGYIESKRRVKTIRLRKKDSMGLIMKLDSLSFTGGNLSDLKVGLEFSSFNGVDIFDKYETKATRLAKERVQKQQVKNIKELAEVGDTKKFRNCMNSIPAGALITISEKIHGTSGRTGKVLLRRKITQGFWEKLFRRPIKTKSEYTVVTGSRKRTVAVGTQERRFTPSGSPIPFGYRVLIHNELIDLLRPGEAIYYEIISCDNNGIPEFKHSVPDDSVGKSVRKRYGKTILYRYNCSAGKYKIFIYKITVQNELGDVTTLSWNQMVARANELGIPIAPEIDKFIYDGDAERLKEYLAKISVGDSILDSTHIREGVVLNIEHPKMFTVMKYKGFDFCHLEGIAKNDDGYIDPEEIS